ncbi:MAG: hypothetical protein KDC53_05525 [Saprospiraceae bacterium]|nr:hypothetical protein [Saprospiraceae bacterium]
MQRISSPDSGNIYLGNADLILSFNQQMFSSPTLNKVGLTPQAYCTFMPQNESTVNNLVTQTNYYNSTSGIIEDNLLIINLNGPTPSDSIVFGTRVAKIDSQISFHRLGRFMISGVNNTNGDPDLRWKTLGTGLKTKFFTLDSIAPFHSFPIELSTEKNTCPDYLEINDPTIPSGSYQVLLDLSVSGMINTPDMVTLRAGVSVELQPDFSIQTGGTLQIQIGGCQ